MDHTPSTDARARRVDHVAIATRDADKTAAWYAASLGLEVVGDERVESAGVRLVYLLPGDGDPDRDTMVQLAEPFGPGAVAEFMSQNGEGLHHVCFTVDSIPQVLDRLGGDVSSIFRGGRERNACFLEERPNGVVIELTETAPIGEEPNR